MGAPWKCLNCDARWYAMGPPSGQCLDCGSEDIDIDTDPVLCIVCKTEIGGGELCEKCADGNDPFETSKYALDAHRT